MEDKNLNNVNNTETIRPRKKRKKGPDYRIAYIIGGALVLILIVVGIILGVKSCGKKETEETVAETVAETEPETEPVETEAPTKSAEELEAEAAAKSKEDAIAAYGNLGIANVSDGGYLNVRQQPNAEGEVIGKLYHHSACTIEDVSAEDSSWYDPSEWLFITSGGFQGYVKAEYILTGDDAKNIALESFAKRAVITADKLRVRAEPEADADVLTSVYQNERYEVLGEPEGWVRIDLGYISADYVEIKECLNEARRVVEDN